MAPGMVTRSTRRCLFDRRIGRARAQRSQNETLTVLGRLTRPFGARESPLAMKGWSRVASIYESLYYLMVTVS